MYNVQGMGVYTIHCRFKISLHGFGGLATCILGYETRVQGAFLVRVSPWKESSIVFQVKKKGSWNFPRRLPRVEINLDMGEEGWGGEQVFPVPRS